MRKVAWLAIGAVGGIVVYRRVERLVEDARERGVVVTAQQATAKAMDALDALRQANRGE